MAIRLFLWAGMLAAALYGGRTAVTEGSSLRHIDRQLAEARAHIAAIDSERTRAEKDLADYRAEVEAMPDSIRPFRMGFVLQKAREHAKLLDFLDGKENRNRIMVRTHERNRREVRGYMFRGIALATGVIVLCGTGIVFSFRRTKA